MPARASPQKRSFFGLAALIIAVASALFLGASYAVSQLDITPAAFGMWNSLTALAYCITVPIACILGLLGYRGVNDSKKLSLIAISVAGVPFLILLGELVWSFLK